jgi:hypothetical protein
VDLVNEVRKPCQVKRNFQLNPSLHSAFSLMLTPLTPIFYPRVRGIIFDPEGRMESTFAWGLGTSTNNQDEAYALFQGLLLANDSNIESMIIVGDSSVIIKSMVLHTTLKDNKLASIIARINKVVQNLSKGLILLSTEKITTLEPIG